ncbi:hypothetical protein [Sulfuriferula sp. AH1]|uniref:hypothetical protein n=1 Tax=Sulfuriferula sp. AH1 TaxID=1985873 RepID=UPI0012F7A255|nr:hypothetical protein [Sulfuriferula sp. AH1]
MARDWTPEARAKQAELIRGWMPWKSSSGARTPQGKAISAQNRAKSLERAKQRIADARKALRDAEAEHTRLTGRDTVSPFAQLAAEMNRLIKIRR